MDTGEKELRKAFEEVTTRNVRSAVDHGNETRRLTREIEEKIARLEMQVMQQRKLIDDLQTQVTSLNIVLYSNGLVK
jgi:hypothetical protein